VLKGFREFPFIFLTMAELAGDGEAYGMMVGGVLLAVVE
jgi:hypothetical protein